MLTIITSLVLKDAGNADWLTNRFWDESTSPSQDTRKQRLSFTMIIPHYFQYYFEVLNAAILCNVQVSKLLS